ncbi:hypothetical protein [Desulfatitalea tepidiphila]|uniref:hypothetical protein n=1 Tax=Desulfatitalea tepidiphila TaxID=1185843 RepID=UPI00350E3862
MLAEAKAIQFVDVLEIFASGFQGPQHIHLGEFAGDAVVVVEDQNGAMPVLGSVELLLGLFQCLNGIEKGRAHVDRCIFGQGNHQLFNG